MFEKEAKEYAHEHCCDSCKNLQARYRKVYQDGAEFGYNKANEWHYVKDGDLPSDRHGHVVINQDWDKVTIAKEIIKDLLKCLPKENIEGIYEVTEEAEQFLYDGVEK